MSAVKVMRALLLAHAPLMALVSPAQVMAGNLPLNTPLPAVTIKEVSSNDLATVSGSGDSVTVVSRVQITVHCNTYPQMVAVHDAAKLGSGRFRGVVAGVNVLSVVRAGVGPDFDIPSLALHQKSRDFIVTFACVN